MSRPPGHIGVHDAGQDGMNAHACPAKRVRGDCVRLNAAAFETE